MLYELQNITQTKGQPKRKWFTDEFFDLILWLNSKNEIIRFQLCFNKDVNEQAITWQLPSTYTAHKVDDGEINTGSKGTPTLIPGGEFDKFGLANKFMESSKKLDGYISRFVYQKILDFKTAEK